MKVLFLNHKQQQCGVYQYGKRVADILQKSKDISYTYVEIDSLDQYVARLNRRYDFIIYNYHSSTMPWLQPHTMQKLAKNVGIYHESGISVTFDILIHVNPSSNEDSRNWFIPRPLFTDEYVSKIVLSPSPVYDFISYGKDKDIP